MNNRYLQMLSNLQNNSLEKVDNYLVVDGTNTFMRAAAANPTISDTGQAIGALSGFLLSVGSAIKTLKISDVIIVFDGKNTRVSRQKLFPEYKANRLVRKRIIRNDLITSIEEDQEALKWQLMKLIDYIKILPVKVIIADYFEADDIIAYIVNNYLKDKKSYIMSSDKDFYQLINDNIKIWSPTKKRIFSKEVIKEEYNLHPHNFIILKTLTGDKSDNVPGVKGIRLKTLLKLFPFLQENTIFNIDDIFKWCELKIQEKSKFAGYQNVLDFKEQILINYQIMQLQNISMNSNVKIVIDNSIKKPPYRLNKYQLLKNIIEDQLATSIKNPDKWINECWNRIDANITMNTK